jgi:hypothetical protein
MKSTNTLWLPLAAALLAATLPAAAGERMRAADIAKTFEGMTLDGIYENGAFFTETYNDDGSIRYHDSNGADSGKWSVENDQFCTFYSGQQGACFFVQRDGANCFSFFEESQAKDHKGEPADHWTSRGWSRDAASTCPEAPGAEI